MKTTKGSTASPINGPGPGHPGTEPVFWPEEFASPRRALLIGLAGGLFVIAICLLASFDCFHGVKMVIAWGLGLSKPELVQPGSWDIAAVACGGALSLGAGLVHPCLGMAVLMAFRPWLDGYTYPTDNFYFVWGIVLLTGLWGLRTLWRGESPRHGAPVLLFAGFCLVALATAAGSFQFDRSYRSLILWFGYLLLFFLASNSLRSRQALRIVFGIILLTFAAQAWFSILHFEYILSFLRRALMEDRMLRIQFFGEDRFSPDLIDRFNVNRAFGSMLHPNALAGFLVLGIPYAVTQGLFGWGRLVVAWRTTPRRAGSEHDRRKAFAVSAGLWFLCAAVFFVSALFPLTYTKEPAGDAALYEAAVISAVAALAPAALAGWVASTRGFAMLGGCLRVSGLSVLSVVGILALWFTYSRGGMLALLFASLAAFLLHKGLPRRKMLVRAAGVGLMGFGALLLAANAVWMLTGTASAQSESTPAPAASDASPGGDLPADSKEVAPNMPAPAPEGLIEEGTGVTLKKLLNPLTMSRRLSYWRVGWRMFMGHWGTGVGLGCFGVAYPMHQYVGAEDVSQAHNGFLQAFCETGVAGGLLLIAFCSHFAIWGAWRIRGIRDSRERVVAASLYAGILAFLAHAMIDVHFSHPSLMMFWMVFAGIFYARAGLGHGDAGARPGLARPFIAAIPVLLLAAVTAGMGMRVYLHDLALSRVSFINVAKMDALKLRYQAADYVLRDITAYGIDRSRPKPRVPVAAVQTIVPHPEILGRVGAAYAPLPDTPKGMRRISAGETLPPDATLVIDKPWDLVVACWHGTVDWTKELERIDKRYPYSADLAMHLCEWYFLFAQTLRQDEPALPRPALVEKLLTWSETSVSRSPFHADMHLNRGEALWTCGSSLAQTPQREYFERAIEEFRIAQQLAPNTPLYLQRYAEALIILGEGIRDAGDAAGAETCFQRAKELHHQLERLNQERGKRL